MTGNTCPWMGGKLRITGGKLVLLSVVRGTHMHTFASGRPVSPRLLNVLGCALTGQVMLLCRPLRVRFHKECQKQDARRAVLPTRIPSSAPDTSTASNADSKNEPAMKTKTNRSSEVLRTPYHVARVPLAAWQLLHIHPMQNPWTPWGPCGGGVSLPKAVHSSGCTRVVMGSLA